MINGRVVTVVVSKQSSKYLGSKRGFSFPPSPPPPLSLAARVPKRRSAFEYTRYVRYVGGDEVYGMRYAVMWICDVDMASAFWRAFVTVTLTLTMTMTIMG